MVIDMGFDLLDSFDRIFVKAGTNNPNSILLETRNARKKKKAASKAALSAVKSGSGTTIDSGSIEGANPSNERSADQEYLPYKTVQQLLKEAFDKKYNDDETLNKRRAQLCKNVKKDGDEFNFEFGGYKIKSDKKLASGYKYDASTKTLSVNFRLMMLPYILKKEKDELFTNKLENIRNITDVQKRKKEEFELYYSTLNDAFVNMLSRHIPKYKTQEEMEADKAAKEAKAAKKAEKGMGVPPKDEKPQEEPKQEQPTEPKPEEQPTQETEPKKEDDFEGPEEDHTDHEWFNIIAEKFDKEYSHDLQNDVEPGMTDDEINDLGQTYYDDLMTEYDDKVSDDVKQKVHNYIVKCIKKESGPAQNQNPNQNPNNPDNDKEPGDDDFKWDDGQDGDDGKDAEPQKPENEPKEKTEDEKPSKGRFSGLLDWVQHVGAEGGAANFSDGGQLPTP